MLDDAQRATALLAGMAQTGGLKLDAETTAELARKQDKYGWLVRASLVVGAISLAVIAFNLAT